MQDQGNANLHMQEGIGKRWGWLWGGLLGRISYSRLPLTAVAPQNSSLRRQRYRRQTQELVWLCFMANDAGEAMARLGAALCKVGNRAQCLKALLARLVIHHGMPFVQKLAQQLARLVQYWQRAAVVAQYRLRTVVPLESLERIVGRLGRRAVAALVLALNSHALSIAARQLITISLNSSQDGNPPGQAYSCHVRLLGGQLW